MLAVRKALGILVSLIALAGVLITVVLATRRIDQRPRTDDAYLQADLVHMAPDVSGRIVELDVRDNQAVHKGDVLFRIDPEPYRMRVDQARAAVRGLEAKLALIADQVAAQISKAGAAERGIGSAEAQRALASSTLGRMEPPGSVLDLNQWTTARRTSLLRCSKNPRRRRLKRFLQALGAYEISADWSWTFNSVLRTRHRSFLALARPVLRPSPFHRSCPH